VGIKEGALALNGRPLSFPQCDVISSRQRPVNNDTVVPESNASGSPLPLHGQVGCKEQVLTEEVYHMNILLALQFFDVRDKGRVVVE